MRDLARRLDRLEVALAPRAAFTGALRIVQRIGESAEVAIARAFPEGVPADASLIIRQIIAPQRELGAR